uniref:Copper transport protein n=2 Tax=Theileria annulata TaxID=5874 RepID=Q8WPI0_THEAN|nr:surface protein [Theileria annulata]
MKFFYLFVLFPILLKFCECGPFLPLDRQLNPIDFDPNEDQQPLDPNQLIDQAEQSQEPIQPTEESPQEQEQIETQESEELEPETVTVEVPEPVTSEESKESTQTEQKPEQPEASPAPEPVDEPPVQPTESTPTKASSSGDGAAPCHGKHHDDDSDGKESKSDHDKRPKDKKPFVPKTSQCCGPFFTNSYKIVVAFDWWLCDKPWQYALTLLALFGFSLLSPCLKAYREVLRAKAIRSFIFDCFLTHLFLFLIAFCAYALDFLLMLVVMTFNVGVFFAVITGYTVGYLLSSLAYSTLRSHPARSSSFSRINEDCC